jgi:DNA-binding transcriptional LysR family regulator
VHHPGWDRRLAEFFEQHPKVTLSVTIETTADVIKAVERGVATVGLCDGIIPANLDRLPYKQERYALYCGVGHRLFGVEGVSLNELRGDPYIAFTADVLGGQHMNAVTAVRAVGSFGQQVRAVSSHVEEVIRLIAANIGIGMLPDHLAAPHVATSRLWQLPPYDTLPIAEVFRITNPIAILNPAEMAFLDHMRDLAPIDHRQHQQN